MTRRSRKAVSAGVLFAAAALLLAACGGPQKSNSDANATSSGTAAGGGSSSNCPSGASTPITGDIKIGMSSPLSGSTAALGQLSTGFQKYVDYVNSQGGVNGHKIDLTILDDKGQPANAVANAQKLISDGVDLLAGTSSTAQNLAIAPIAVQECVPDVFLGSGNSDLASGKYPGVLPATTTFAAEATAVTADILKQKPTGAKLGIIAVQTDTGTGVSTLLKNEAEAKGITVLPIQTVAAAQTTAPTTQLQALANKADFLELALSPNQCPVAVTGLAQSGWKPTATFVIDQCAFPSALKPAGANANGMRSVTYLIDPCNPAYANRPDVKTYLSAASGGSIDTCGYSAVGWINGAGTVAVIKQAIASGKLTRTSLIAAAENLKNVTLPLVPDGVVASTTPTSTNPWNSIAIVQYNDGHFTSLSTVKVK